MKTQLFATGVCQALLVKEKVQRSLRVAQKKGVSADPSNGCCGEKSVGRMTVGLAQQWIKLEISVG